MYVKLSRGTVGPLDRAMFQKLVASGEIRRDTPVSRDRAHWRVAGDVSGIAWPVDKTSKDVAEEGETHFETGSVDPLAIVNGDPRDKAMIEAELPTVSTDVLKDASDSSSVAGQHIEWWCMRNGERVGPMSRDKMLELCETAAVSESDLVWNKMLSDWLPIHQVPELRSRLGSEKKKDFLGPGMKGAWEAAKSIMSGRNSRESLAVMTMLAALVAIPNIWFHNDGAGVVYNFGYSVAEIGGAFFIIWLIYLEEKYKNFVSASVLLLIALLVAIAFFGTLSEQLAYFSGRLKLLYFVLSMIQIGIDLFVAIGALRATHICRVGKEGWKDELPNRPIIPMLDPYVWFIAGVGFVILGGAIITVAMT